MPTANERIGAFWREHTEAYVNKFTDTVLTQGLPSYSTITRDQLLGMAKLLARSWQEAFDSEDSAPIRAFGRELGQRRAQSHIALDDIMRVADTFRALVWDVLKHVYADGDWEIAAVARVEDWLHILRNSIVSSYGTTLAQTEQQLAVREEALEAQSHLIQELSVPIAPIYEGVLVLPLVGAIDSRRAMQIMESTLDQIVAYQADVLILDITGVALVDTGVANYLLQMVRAVTLLGTRSVLVGISAEVAQTLTQLGVDLHTIAIRANLRDGIAYALEYLGWAIQPLN